MSTVTRKCLPDHPFTGPPGLISKQKKEDEFGSKILKGRDSKIRYFN